jgi:hypothetical protein
MLHKQPELRPSAPAVAAALQQVQGEADHRTADRGFSFPKPPGNMGRKFRFWFHTQIIWWTIAALGASLLGAAAVFILRSRFAPEKTASFQQVTSAASENRVTAAAISADGNSLIFADAKGIIHLRDMVAGDTATVPEFRTAI